jgi:hypothetical protein
MTAQPIHVYLSRETSLVTDQDVVVCARALDAQVTNELRKTWGVDAKVYPLADPSRLPKGAWVVRLLDDSDEQGALGYHEVTEDGAPVSRVFVATDRKYGLNWTVTASHEVLEMLVDPWCTLACQVDGRTLYGWELCDPVEADVLGYERLGVQVSDFVLPGWFTGFGPQDERGVLTQKLSLAAGGYCSVGVATSSRIVWSQRVQRSNDPAHATRANYSHRWAFRDALSEWAAAL